MRTAGATLGAAVFVIVGARLAVAVDADSRLVRALRDNAALLGLEELDVLRDDAFGYLAREARRFDVIFLEPPFADELT